MIFLPHYIWAENNNAFKLSVYVQSRLYICYDCLSFRLKKKKVRQLTFEDILSLFRQ